ncbi:hypothetical protein BDV12DRAFT_200214 [Aspergillus spectabilis]
MEIGTDTETAMKPLPPITQEFTPLNSPEAMKKEEEEEDEDEALPSIKSEDMEEGTPTLSKGSTNTPIKGKGKASAKETPTPTPRKRSRKPANASATTTPSKKARKNTETNGNGNCNDAESPSVAANGTEGGAGTSSAAGTLTRANLPPIPTSLAKAGVEDRLILRLRDQENRPWAEINKVFVATTGIKVGSSTLRMRHTTMKANFAGITEEDEFRLLRLKKEIEDKFETEKWHRIVEAIVQDGGEKYPTAALQMKFRELSKKSAACDSSSLSSSGSGAGSNSANVKDEEE